MSSRLLESLGFDKDDPKVRAVREDAAVLANLIETLVRARLERKLTQEHVAAAMDTTQSAVSNFERVGGDPKLSTILRYARAIGARVQFVTSLANGVRLVPARTASSGSPETLSLGRDVPDIHVERVVRASAPAAAGAGL